MLNKIYPFMKSISKFVLVSLIFLLNTSFAQMSVQKDLVKIQSYQSFDKVYPGTEFKIAVEVQVAEGWHINSHEPYDEYLIPTSLTIVENPKFKLKKVAYPEPHDLKLAFSESPLSVWEGTVYKGALVEVDSNLTLGTYPLVVDLEYQACNDISCQAPTSVTDTLNIEVADKTTPVNSINEKIFEEIDISLTQPTANKEKDSDPISNALESNGLLIGLFFVFLGGLALNLTPCVYPLIPITIGYFGGQSEGSTTKLFFMGILFILGLAVTYSAIGVITSLTGAVFGALLQNPIVILAVVAVLFVLSLSMFGVYEFKLPDKLVNKAGGAKAGLYGAFFMGLTMGIVAAPCIGPFVLGLVTYVATKQDPYFGFLLFFVLAVGLGTPYLFLAVFSGKIKKIPRAGEWMDAVKHIFGFILVGMALYFLLPLLPESFRGYVLPVFMVGTAIYLLFFEKLANSVKGFRIFKIVFSILILAIAVYTLIPSETNSVNWKPFTKDALTEISGKGVIVDFYADWCIPCKELDAATFSDPRVIELSKDFETYKADMTKSLSPEVEAIREQYNIIGVPTVLILNSKGEEKERITGFVNADEFYKIISEIN
ncbi:MAG: thioredoxin fold domain-containing protein [Ignavibacteriaceae bacterium]|nr:thioredoxin fold domain-containing protein [Ignavibacteriaceae bacterium]MCW8812043.1 thioredoxin fold domain-containing protein [Chlorobium sp.]MCW8818547.1 thioredoxin fold domain-containing protein [Ignavibacteriaceae bacterium]